MRRRWKPSPTHSKKPTGAAKMRRRCSASATKPCSIKSGNSIWTPGEDLVRRPPLVLWFPRARKAERTTRDAEEDECNLLHYRRRWVPELVWNTGVSLGAVAKFLLPFSSKAHGVLAGERVLALQLFS